MKKLTAFALLSAVSLFASDRPEAVRPNMYTCELGNTSVHYTTSSIVGKPTFSVTFQGKTPKLNAFPEINVQTTRIGNLVSVTDAHMALVDGPTIRYTLVLPSTFLNSNQEQAEFETVVVRTSVPNPFMHPQSFTGVVEHNVYENVKCTAQQVFF